MKHYYGIALISLVYLCLTIGLPVEYRSLDHQYNNMVETNELQVTGDSSSKHWSVKCWSCRLLITSLKTLLKQETAKDAVGKAIVYICEEFNIETDRVCTGIVQAFKDEVLTVFDLVVIDPDELCGFYISASCGEGRKYLFPPWNVTIPPPSSPSIKQEPVSTPEPGAPISKVLHISDTHYDSWYEEGMNTKCGEPLCCRKNDGPPPKGGLAAGKFGYYKCDTPTVTLDGLFKHVASLKHKIDYILWTGDVPAHNVWNQSRTDQMNAIKKATKLFLEFFPGVKIYPTLGNHESAPVNSFPPPFITGEQSNQWLLDTIAESWGHWLPEECQKTIKKGGFYTTLIGKGFRIVSLNMNYCNDQNWWLMIKSKDPAGMLAWLIEVLQEAEKNKEKVHIIGHIPPGNGGCIKYWSQNYYDIIDRYQSTVVGQFFGHTHHDHFEIFYDKKTYKTPTNIAYIGPSVTPFTDVNPGYRIYDIDGDYANSSRVVLNHETYIIDLEKANKLGVATWEYEYNAKDLYKMPSLTAKDWNDLVNRMYKDDALFQLFYKNYVKQHVISKCDQRCKMSLLCSLKEGKSYTEGKLCHFDAEQIKEHRAFMFSLRKC